MRVKLEIPIIIRRVKIKGLTGFREIDMVLDTGAYSADSGHSFRSMAATSVGAKRRWDFKIFYRSITFRQVFVFFSWNLLSIEYDERCEPAGRG